MDEYLFITLAKLKADRLKLEREQRAFAEPPSERFQQQVRRVAAQPPKARWFSRQPLWREQS